MLDIETLGTSPGSIILSIGAVRFDAGGCHESFYALVDARDCERHGLRADVGTIFWWVRQELDARREAFRPGPRMPLLEALTKLTQFVEGADEIWANSPNFDVSILESAFRACSLSVPWTHKVLCDLRTIRTWTCSKHAVLLPPAHHALTDARAQVMDLLEIERRWLTPAAAAKKIEPDDARLLESLPTA